MDELFEILHDKFTGMTDTGRQSDAATDARNDTDGEGTFATGDRQRRRTRDLTTAT